MAISRKVLLPPAGAATVAVAVAAAAYGVVATLPQPTHGDRTAVRVLRVLETKRGGGSEIVIGGATVQATCRRTAPHRSFVTLSDGNTFVLSGSHIRAWSSPQRSLASVEEEPLLHAAEADLAGSYALYVDELTAELEHGEHVLGRVTTFAGRRVYKVHLGSARPRAALFVDRQTLEPLGASFESKTLTGHSTLHPARPGRGQPGC
jgi:hypothetical protein